MRDIHVRINQATVAVSSLATLSEFFGPPRQINLFHLHSYTKDPEQERKNKKLFLVRPLDDYHEDRDQLDAGNAVFLGEQSNFFILHSHFCL